MRFTSALIAIAVFASQTLAGSSRHDNHTNFVQTCAENGFASESYTVITEDGYVSQLYRIPGKVGDTSAKKPAVLLQHGLECDMNFWTPNEPSVTPAFVLASQGYDVWLGNNRGTRYANNHTTLDTKSAEYWRFSQEEYGRKDLPAFIDHILAATGQEKLTYIGHSQGTTQMFLGASLDPDYFNSRVNLFVALGPVTTLNNIQNPQLRVISKDWKELEWAMQGAGFYNLVDENWMEIEAGQIVCNRFIGLCADLLRWLADSDTDVDNLDRYDVFIKDFVAGSGYQNIVYYAQAIQSEGKLLRYDFGGVKNMEKYGTFHAPEVPLSNLSLPTGLFIGLYDKLATIKDNEWLVTQLKEDVVVHNKVYPLGHLSFTLAKDMSYFTGDVMDLVNQYATNSFSSDETLFLALN